MNDEFDEDSVSVNQERINNKNVNTFGAPNLSLNTMINDNSMIEF
jgi:hypothetical protein